MERTAGGVLIVFAGAVLLLAAIKGSLKNVWNAIWVPDTSSGSTSGQASSSITNNPISQFGSATAPTNTQFSSQIGNIVVAIDPTTGGPLYQGTVLENGQPVAGFLANAQGQPVQYGPSQP